jgi:Transcriptional regulator
MKANRTKEKLLQIGVNQASINGISGITLGTLASESGMSKSGLFAHFGSKEQLQIDLLNESAQIGQQYVVEPAMRAGVGLPRLKKLVNLWFGWWRRADLGGGCPVAAALFELDDIENVVAAHAREMDRQWRALLAQLVREAIEAKHFSADTDVDQFVWELCGIYLAHHVSSRFSRDKTSDSRAKRAFAALLARHEP